MAYIETINGGRRKARKAHQCFDCQRDIVKGQPHEWVTLKADGDIYTLRQHIDCCAAADHYRRFHKISFWDDEGFPPLWEMIHDAGEFEIDCGMLRGRFPHVVARLELNQQLSCVR